MPETKIYQKEESSTADLQPTVPTQSDEPKKTTTPEQSDETQKLEARVKDLQATIQERNTELDQANGRLAWQARRLASMNEGIESLGQKLASTERELASKEQEVNQLQHQRAEEGERIRKLQELFDTCDNKLSWLSYETANSPAAISCRVAQLRMAVDEIRGELGILRPRDMDGESGCVMS
ncbi:hypothetical protein PG996_003016 [Apiospora saccharicola]|uniref:Uncharacterized protein n=1 Tax=Apiospora saccharicola TaxID=335842 RepID=A0ABR1W018_9PEZI